MTVDGPDDGWPDPRKRPPGGDVGSVLDDRAREGRPSAWPPPARHPYVTLLLVGPLVACSLLAVGLLLSGLWSTVLTSPVRLFLIVLGILFPVAAFAVLHRRGRGVPPHPRS